MKLTTILFTILFGLQAAAQDLLKFEVLAGNTDGTDCPVSLSIDQLNYNTDSLKLALFEINGKTDTAIPFQLETASGGKVWFILNGLTQKNTKRTFVLRKMLSPQTFNAGITVVQKDGALNLISGEKPILSYQIETVNPPKGIRYEGTEGWIFVSRGDSMYVASASDPVSKTQGSKALDASDPKILNSVIRENEIHLYKSDEQHGNWLECVQTKKEPISPAEIGHSTCSISSA